MYAVIDVETTGLFNKDRIVEIAVAQLDRHGTVTATWETLVNPQRDLGPQELHGIRAADVRKAPTFDQIAGDVAGLLEGRVPVAHNLAFDSRLLAHEYLRLGCEIPNLGHFGVCTMQWADYFLPDAGRSLADCCLAAGIPNDRPHEAMSDVLATAELLTLYLNSMGTVPLWDDRAAGLGEARWPPIPRRATEPVRRGIGASDGGAFLARLVDHIPRVPDPPQADMYLALLDRALVDRHISATEADSLVALASGLGIGRAAAIELHRGYLLSLATAALEDGFLSDAERDDLNRVAALLSLPADDVDAALRVAEKGTAPLLQQTEFRLKRGDTAVLTGAFAESKSFWAKRLEAAGLTVAPNVTKKTALVVAADPDSMSGKASKARQYGIPVVGVDSLDTVLARVATGATQGSGR
ncbi:exonuclease domain-containing protein [Glycomyces artemisiae]|uniref:DNA polymerase-3 subunit epsilon n=1 Tax=Glycomyces artemisiae TaxID=1076443 RepID=A0A2T0U811_9ACTN|nr:exonuclease domain-containing protein [Glycomyces artemisiae]PRY54056.1 DNA polymerase-3 subunit epsilon [Glycomyces artemisiae]